MVRFYMVEQESFVVKNISTLKTDVFTLFKDYMVKVAFTVIFTILVGKIPARFKCHFMNVFEMYV